MEKARDQNQPNLIKSTVVSISLHIVVYTKDYADGQYTQYGNTVPVHVEPENQRTRDLDGTACAVLTLIKLKICVTWSFYSRDWDTLSLSSRILVFL